LIYFFSNEENSSKCFSEILRGIAFKMPDYDTVGQSP